MKLLILSILFTSLAFANENDLKHLPKSFKYKDGFAIFTDFSEANYDITYDLNKSEAYAKAVISFETIETGFPIFDTVKEPNSIQLDGKSVTASLTKTPSSETSLRVINEKIPSGVHTLVIELPITELVEFKSNGVKSAFWTSDLDERNYLELYLPANFEFDQLKMSFQIHFIGLKDEQTIYSNGLVQQLDQENYQITFPSHFTASSIFYHTVPKSSFDEVRFTIHSIDGRDIPTVIYRSKSIWMDSLERVKQNATTVIHELEKDYGAFPHSSITIYQAGSGGMEYCGATMSDYSSLGHELFHSYFARGLMPANGNTGWLDEALASWRDDGYQTLTSLSGTSGMSSHPYYTRITDDAAYQFGKRFMGYMNGKTLPHGGGLKPFLHYMIATRLFRPIFVEEFIQEMSNFYQMSFADDFNHYTFDQSNHLPSGTESLNPHHHKMGLKELKKFL